MPCDEQVSQHAAKRKADFRCVAATAQNHRATGCDIVAAALIGTLDSTLPLLRSVLAVLASPVCDQTLDGSDGRHQGRTRPLAWSSTIEIHIVVLLEMQTAG
jgi:hypothetical protein